MNTNNPSIKARFDDIEKKLGELSTSNQLSDTLTAYNRLTVELNECKELLNAQVKQYESMEEPIIDKKPQVKKGIKKETTPDDDSLFNAYVKKMEELRERIENEEELEELINIYRDANFYSMWIKEYLNKKKMRIIEMK
jgi:hypothetical protein